MKSKKLVHYFVALATTIHSHFKRVTKDIYGEWEKLSH